MALPELDGAMEPIVFAGRDPTTGKAHTLPDRVESLTTRAIKWAALRKKKVAEKKLAITVFSFPPDKGNVGTAAYLNVFGSIFKVLKDMQRQGYDVRALPPHVQCCVSRSLPWMQLGTGAVGVCSPSGSKISPQSCGLAQPARSCAPLCASERAVSGARARVQVGTIPRNEEELIKSVLNDGEARFNSADLNVAYRMSVDEYYKKCDYATSLEENWGPAPGQLNTNGQDLLIFGKQFGNVFIGVQPTFGYEGDPMRLLFSKSASPHHGFAAYYTFLEKVFEADAVLHFGTHGSLEFMPGKQARRLTRCVGVYGRMATCPA